MKKGRKTALDNNRVLCQSNLGKGGECGGGREESGRGSAGGGRVAWKSIAAARQSRTEGEVFQLKDVLITMSSSRYVH